MKKVELLAPAGNYDALRGAIKAGADAVYLGGNLYGARAYADNFTQDEICTGIHLAHVFGRRVYLTVNTLVKEKELDGLYNFLLPLYEAGLDGVIIQDLGVLRYVRRHFPDLLLHASTQMTLTGKGGVSFIKAEGVSRIVPARELSLEEIKRIKEETDIEIEAFIHGAMCYCYSGQCLLSSILGGRSGNRGRCAQPCRLPYRIGEEMSGYPLSMRDMCTISILPELIAAGIDSFKIEGRMKKPAYAAGVTAVYRKYIDLYYADNSNYVVSEEDIHMLKSLYIRSEIGDGYYKRHNGREMITLDSPAYSATDEKLLADIEAKYIKEEIFHKASAKVCLIPEKEAELVLTKDELSISVRGDIVQQAIKQPLLEEKIKEQIQKSGNSLVRIHTTEVETEDAVFMPIRSLNELRRKALFALEEAIIRQNGLDYGKRKAIAEDSESRREQAKQCIKECKRERLWPHREGGLLHVLVNTMEQLEAALKEKVSRIYIDYSLLYQETGENSGNVICMLKEKEGTAELYLTSPYIVREKEQRHLEKIEQALETGVFSGVLVRNLESFHFFCKRIMPERIVLDANLYIWNREAIYFWKNQAAEFYLPVECNFHEWNELLSHCADREIKASVVVYGRLPMMITANCLNKTGGTCNKKPGFVMLTDRYEKQFPVYADCLSCYNVIYNSVPLSLHGLFKEKQCLNENYRLDFITEGRRETELIIQYFKGLSNNYQPPFYKNYTTGHLKRGVE